MLRLGAIVASPFLLGSRSAAPDGRLDSALIVATEHAEITLDELMVRVCESRGNGKGEMEVSPSHPSSGSRLFVCLSVSFDQMVKMTREKVKQTVGELSRKNERKVSVKCLVDQVWRGKKETHKPELLAILGSVAEKFYSVTSFGRARDVVINSSGVCKEVLINAVVHLMRLCVAIQFDFFEIMKERKKERCWLTNSIAASQGPLVESSAIMFFSPLMV